jgi:alpha-1,6-mannosyltransferase
MILLAVAVASALAWAVWVLWVPLLPANLYTPLLDLGKITGYRWPSAVLYLGLVVVLYALYAVGYRAVRRSNGGADTAVIFGVAVVFCAELLWAYPATAVDIFGYIAAGNVLAIHQANPFVVAPSAFPTDPIMPFLAFPDEPSQYGPIWALLAGAIASVGQDNLLGQVLLYKIVAALAHLASAAVVYRIALRLASDTSLAQASAYLFLWNPLLLWEMVGNGHNDGLMMLFALIGVWLFTAGYDLLSLTFVAAGALVKVPVALIGPSLFVAIWKRAWARAVEGAVLGLVLAAAVYRPFWEGPQTLTALRRTDLFTASLGSVVRLALEPATGLDNASFVARTLSLALFTLVAVVALLLAIRASTAAEALAPAYITLLGALLLLTTWFQAWYVVWPFAIGAALADPRRHTEVALLSLGGLLQYFVFIYLWVMGYFPPTENLGVQAAAYLAIVGPLLVGLAVRRLRQEPRWANKVALMRG